MANLEVTSFVLPAPRAKINEGVGKQRDDVDRVSAGERPFAFSPPPVLPYPPTCLPPPLGRHGAAVSFGPVAWTKRARPCGGTTLEQARMLRGNPCLSCQVRVSLTWSFVAVARCLARGGFRTGHSGGYARQANTPLSPSRVYTRPGTYLLLFSPLGNWLIPLGLKSRIAVFCLSWVVNGDFSSDRTSYPVVPITCSSSSSSPSSSSSSSSSDPFQSKLECMHLDNLGLQSTWMQHAVVTPTSLHSQQEYPVMYKSPTYIQPVVPLRPRSPLSPPP